MKKLLMAIGFFFLIASAQGQISDTTAYLNDSIIQRKVMFIGQPLSVLVKNLKLQIHDTYCLVGNVDTFVTNNIWLELFPLNEFLNRSLNQKKTPTIIVTFQNQIKTPRELFLPGKALDLEMGWTKQKAIYWGQFIVADIRVIGI